MFEQTYRSGIFYVFSTKELILFTKSQRRTLIKSKSIYVFKKRLLLFDINRLSLLRN